LWAGVLGPAAGGPCRCLPRTPVFAGIRRFCRAATPLRRPRCRWPSCRRGRAPRPSRAFASSGSTATPSSTPRKRGSASTAGSCGSRTTASSQTSSGQAAPGSRSAPRSLSTICGRCAGADARLARWLALDSGRTGLSNCVLSPSFPGHPRRRRPRDLELRPFCGIDRHRQPQRPAGVGRQHQDPEPGVPRPVPEHDQRHARQRSQGDAHRKGTPGWVPAAIPGCWG